MNTDPEISVIDPLGEYGVLKSRLGDHDGWLLVTDSNTSKYCREIFLNSTGLAPSGVCVIEDGEKAKQIRSCELIWEKLTNLNAGRNFALVNLGGGVVTDTGGFAASCYKRGINFYNIPTSLLAMADAAYGGKTGVNFGDIKNQLGHFSFPSGIYIDTRYLVTLSESELVSGYAEILKHALIADPQFWNELKLIKHPVEIVDWNDILRKSVKIKSAIVVSDPFEQGQRKLLNFGHSIGHAVESLFNEYLKIPLAHGNAVAFGMICESEIAVDQGLLKPEILEEIHSLLVTIFGNLELDQKHHLKVLEFLRNDKKNRDNNLNFTLISGIGRGLIDQVVSENQVIVALEYYKSRS